MFSFMAETFWPFYKNFQGFTYCSVFKVLCCSCLFSATASIVYHAAFCLSRTFLNFFLISFRNPWVSFRSLSRSLGTGIRIPDVLPNVNIFFSFFLRFSRFFFLFLLYIQDKAVHPVQNTRYAAWTFYWLLPSNVNQNSTPFSQFSTPQDS